MRQEKFVSRISYFEIGCIVVLLLIIGMTSFLTIHTKKNLGYGDFFVEICFLLFISLLLWIYFHIKYTFESYELRIDCEWRKLIIPYSSIDKVYRRPINPFFKKYNRKNRRKCGLGMIMIVIVYLENDELKEVMISPREEDLFLEELYRRSGKKLEARW